MQIQEAIEGLQVFSPQLPIDNLINNINHELGPIKQIKKKKKKIEPKYVENLFIFIFFQRDLL